MLPIIFQGFDLIIWWLLSWTQNKVLLQISFTDIFPTGMLPKITIQLTIQITIQQYGCVYQKSFQPSTLSAVQETFVGPVTEDFCWLYRHKFITFSTKSQCFDVCEQSNDVEKSAGTYFIVSWHKPPQLMLSFIIITDTVQQRGWALWPG